MGGLGKVFFEQVTETIKLIGQFPDIWTQNSLHTRRAILRKFPYSLIYSILINMIYIIAIAHQNRQPEYWIDRFIGNK